MSDFPENLTFPAADADAIVPSDTSDLPRMVRGLYVGTSGDVSVLLANAAEPVLFRNLVAGVAHPLLVRRVLATGTTAADIVGIV